MTKPITRDAADEMAGHLRSKYPIDRAEVAQFIEDLAAQALDGAAPDAPAVCETCADTGPSLSYRDGVIPAGDLALPFTCMWVCGHHPDDRPEPHHGPMLEILIPDQITAEQLLTKLGAVSTQ
jgi:hypothetical protein